MAELLPTKALPPAQVGIFLSPDCTEVVGDGTAGGGPADVMDVSVFSLKGRFFPRILKPHNA